MIELNEDSLFKVYLDYQLTDEFKSSETTQIEQELVSNRPINRKGSSVYRKNHADLVKLRHEAAKSLPALLDKQSGVCFWCDQLLDDTCEIDHIRPLTKGGTNDLENLCACHQKCNQLKGTKIIEFGPEKDHYRK